MGCLASPRTAPGLPALFEDLTVECGIDFALQGNFGQSTQLQDTFGAPIAVIDVNRDDRPDLLFAGPDTVRWYRNEGEFRFTPQEPGPPPRGRWFGCAVGDFDGDGWQDLFLQGHGCAALWRNRQIGVSGENAPSEPAFEAVSPPGLASALKSVRFPWGSSAAFADLDRDGWLDLVIGRYREVASTLSTRIPLPAGGATRIAPPDQFPAQKPLVLQNREGRDFRDVTRKWGLDRSVGAVLGLTVADLNQDQRPDLLIGTDAGPAEIYLNSPGTRFLPLVTLGERWEARAMEAADLDGDGWRDVFMATGYGRPHAWLRGKWSSKRDRELKFGPPLGGVLDPILLTEVGCGTRAIDLDHDGFTDLALNGGHFLENAEAVEFGTSYFQRFRVLRGRGDRWEPWPGWTDLPVVGRALVSTDLDGDGGIDLVVGDQEGLARVLHNVTPRGNWVGLRLRNRRNGGQTLGATVRYEFGQARREVETRTSGSYLSSLDPNPILSLGPHRSTRVEIQWPSGHVTTRTLISGRWTTIHEE